MAFPGPNARIDVNEAGEPVGWDYPSADEELWDPYGDEQDDWRDLDDIAIEEGDTTA